MIKHYNLLDNYELTFDDAIEIINLPNDYIFDLINLAYKVRKKFSKYYHICSICNAKSGLCPEDCSYCAQSIHNNTNIDTYELLSTEIIIKKAEEIYNKGIRHFGIVTSGYGYLTINNEFLKIIETIKILKSKFPELEVCASLGVLGEENIKLLYDAGITEYNHNLQVNPEKYSVLISKTHNVEDRINTIKKLKKYSIKVCSGCIIGLGETMEDRIKLAFLLKELNVDIIPINILIPIKGTKVENNKRLKVIEALKTFILFRLILKDKIIKFAAGRETIMKDFQGLFMLAGANGFLTGGYLTTRGRNIEDDYQFLEELYEFN